MCDTKARLDGKVAIVTGGSSGVGLEAAKNLARRGARIIIASRNETKLRRAKDEITTESRNNNVEYRRLDLASFRSVRNFVSEIVAAEDRLDILVNNAGAIGLPDRFSEDGLNLTMQVNYFGVFLLTYLLLPLLKQSAPSRILIGSAASMYIGDIDFDHWNDIGRYNLVTSLANSKLADELFAVELSRRLKGTGVTVNTYDPFVVRDTEILDNMPALIKEISRFFIDLIGQKKEEVGQQIAYLAADPKLERVSSKHYKFCGEWINHWLVNDVIMTRELWKKTKEVVGIRKEEDWDPNAIE